MVRMWHGSCSHTSRTRLQFRWPWIMRGSSRANTTHMAKRTCSPTSGSIGPETYLVGKNGQVVRNRVKPRNNKTTAQVAQRSILASVSARWRTLTDDARKAWGTAAAMVRSKERLGMWGNLSGQQLFCKINATLTTFGQAQVDMPPAEPTFPDLAVTSFSASAPAGVAQLTLGCPTDPGQNTVIRASAPQSAGVTRAPRLLIIDMCPTPTAGSSDITSAYVAKFGAIPLGKRIFVSASMQNAGWETMPMTFTAVVPESEGSGTGS